MRYPRRAVRVCLAVLLVGAVVANPLGLALMDQASPVQDSEAQAGITVCAVVSLMTPQECDPGNPSTIDNVSDHLSLYSEGVGVLSQTKSFTDLLENYLQDTTDTAWLIAEREVAEAYQNGSTKAQAKIQAKEAVKEYYSTKEKNLINAWNNHVAVLENMHSQASGIGGTMYGSSGYFATPGITITETPGSYQHSPTIDMSFHQRNVTLSNGNVTMIRSFRVKLQRDGFSSWGEMKWDPVHGAYDVTGYNDGADQDYSADATGVLIALMPPNSDYPQRGYVTTFDWDNWDKIQSNEQEVKSEIDTWVNNTWTDWEAGNINESELISRVNKMENYQVNAVGKNTTFNDAVSGLVASGFSAPNSSYLNITFDPQTSDINGTITKDGLLLSSNGAPNGSWEFNTTYNSQNISGAQLVAGIDGTEWTINGTFEVHGAYQSDGTRLNIQNVSSPERDYTVTNTTELQNQIVQLGEDIEELEARLSNTSSGGGGGVSVDFGLGGLPSQTVLIAGAAALLLLARN